MAGPSGFDAWMLKFQPGSLEALPAPSLVLGGVWMSGGFQIGFQKSVLLPTVSLEPRTVPGTESVPSKRLLNETLLSNLRKALVWASWGPGLSLGLATFWHLAFLKPQVLICTVEITMTLPRND